MNNFDNSNISKSESTPPSKNIDRDVRLFNSPELFGGKNEIMIRHQGEIYKIIITRNGKLVMNK